MVTASWLTRSPHTNVIPREIDKMKVIRGTTPPILGCHRDLTTISRYGPVCGGFVWWDPLRQQADPTTRNRRKPNYDDMGHTLAFFLIFLFAMVIVILNLLIAMMSDVYTQNKDRVEFLMPGERARMIIDLEADMSAAERKDLDKFPVYRVYLRVLRTTNRKDEVVAALPPSGRMGTTEGLFEAKLDELHLKVSKVDQVEAKVDGIVAAEISEVKKMLRLLVVDRADASDEHTSLAEAPAPRARRCNKTMT